MKPGGTPTGTLIPSSDGNTTDLVGWMLGGLPGMARVPLMA